MKKRLPVLFVAALLTACGGGGGANTNPLDLDGDSLLRYPWGTDLDDDGDGAITYLVGGTDYDDTDPDVQTNGGTGSFNGDIVLYPAGDTPIAAALGDLDNDGNLDVAVTNQDDDTLGIYLGIGDGTLGSPTSVPVPNGGGDIDVGDFNEDGNLDLFSRGNVLLGNGDGTFGAPSTLPTQISPASIRDVNGDGHLDIVGTDYDNGLAVALGRGDGTFATPTLASRGNTFRTAFADFNGDGFLDGIGALGAEDAFALFLGGPGGTFIAAATVPVPGYSGDVFTADMNNDGHADVLVASVVGNDIHVLLGNGALTFSAPITNTFPSGVQCLALERFFGTDVHAMVGTTRGLFLSSGGGDGTLSPVAAKPPDAQTHDVVVGDLNHDGVLDVVSVYIGRNEIGVVLGQ